MSPPAVPEEEHDVAMLEEEHVPKNVTHSFSLCSAIQPTELPSKIAQVACGEEHVAFLTINGEVYTAGDNRFGQLGRGRQSMDEESLPYVVTDLLEVEVLQKTWGLIRK